MKIFFLSVLFSLSSFSATRSELEKRRPGLVSKSISKRLDRAYHYMGAKEYPSAIELLKNSAEAAGSNKFAKAKVIQTLAYAYAQSEKYPLAKKAFSEALNLNALPLQPTLQTMFALAQLEVLDKRQNELRNALRHGEKLN